MENLTWRNIYDCKNPGECITTTLLKAKEAHYPYAHHNGRIYRLPYGEPIALLKDLNINNEK